MKLARTAPALEASCSPRCMPAIRQRAMLPGAPQQRRQRGTPRTAALPGLLELDISTALSSLEHAAQQHSVGGGGDALRHLLSLGDAAVAAADAAGAAAAEAKPQDNGWLTPLVDGLEFVLTNIQSGLDRVSLPYSYGWSIVALTALVKLATFPLTKQQVEGTMAMQALKPKIDAIKAKYGEEKDVVSRETSALYEKAGVNPLAGCLPTLATIPIFIGLYRSLTDVAAQGQLDNQGFYWIPSLAGPTSIAAQRAGTGTAWLFPLVDGAPPVGWDLASRYLALPIALVLAQYISSAIISPPVDPNNDNAGVQKAIYLGLPLMVGWFALNVPSGLSLYYFSNTVLTGATQVFLRKLGGAKAAEFDLGPLELGKARRTGTAAASLDEASTASDSEAESNGNGAAEALAFSAAEQDDGAAAEAALAAAAAAAPPQVNRRCKRKRRELLEV